MRMCACAAFLCIDLDHFARTSEKSRLQALHKRNRSVAKNAGKSEVEQPKDKVLLAITKLAGDDGYAKARDVLRLCARGVQKYQRDGVIDALEEDGEIVVKREETGGRPLKKYAVAQDRAQSKGS
jgi:hypothetical protein